MRQWQLCRTASRQALNKFMTLPRINDFLSVLGYQRLVLCRLPARPVRTSVARTIERWPHMPLPSDAESRVRLVFVRGDICGVLLVTP